ncbi:MAG: HD family phosphohydrolase [Saccharofermentanales bacterium]
MKIRKNLLNFIYYISIILIALGIIAAMYYGSLPKKYLIKAGDASPYDINAIRSVEDIQSTIKKANQAALDVKDIMLMDTLINNANFARVTAFFTLCSSIRSETQTIQSPLSNDAAASKLKTQIREQFKKDFTLAECKKIITLEQAAFDSFYSHSLRIAQLILTSPVNRQMLTLQIQTNVEALSQTIEFYSQDISIIVTILNNILNPNIVFNEEATKSARDLAYKTVMDNPVMISKGTRIVNFGEIITEEKYKILTEMELIETNNFDFRYFAGILMLVALILGITFLYANRYEKQNINTNGDKISIMLSMAIPLMISLLVIRLSTLAPPVYIAAVLITAYFGFRSAIVFSTLLTFAILPMTGFDVKFLFVAITGCIIASLFTIGISKRDNYALIIIATTLTCFVATVAFNIMLKTSARETLIDAAFAVGSGSISIIAALGLMPLFEIVFNSVSPLRLIELSQPGSPLLRRLFIEAPGTSQHSVMVGNLVEAGAQAIGANPLIARVGAYYHDIGKLENPEMFTENQEGINPHDLMSPEESVAIIKAHPETGLRIAKRYRLPIPICKMIYEHHGTSKQLYFLHKAQVIAEKNNLPPPDPKFYSYKCPKPSTNEAAILMLADSVEAAMKSNGITNLEDGEKLIRRLIKLKIDDDQLSESDLSFKDIERLIKAFLQVYSGNFRVRVRYPDDIASSKQAAKI